MQIVDGHIYYIAERRIDGTIGVFHVDPSVTRPLTYVSNIGSTFYYDNYSDLIDVSYIAVDGKYARTFTNANIRWHNGNIYFGDGNFFYQGEIIRHSSVLKFDGSIWTLVHDFNGDRSEQVSEVMFDGDDIYVLLEQHLAPNNSIEPHLYLAKLDSVGNLIWKDALISYDEGGESATIDTVNGIIYYLDFNAIGSGATYNVIRRYDYINRVQLADFGDLRSQYDGQFPYYFTEEPGNGMIRLSDGTLVLSVAPNGTGTAVEPIWDSGIAWRSDNHLAYESGHINEESLIVSTSNPTLPATLHAQGYQDEGMCIDGNDSVIWVFSAVDAYLNKFDTITRQHIGRITVGDDTDFPQTYTHFCLGRAIGNPAEARLKADASRQWFKESF